MKKNSVLAISAIATFTALASTPALAQDPAIYLGASIGEAQFRKTCDDVTIGKCDSSDTAYRLYGGYHFGPNLALEVGYGKFGEVLVDTPFASFEATLKGFDISLLPAYRISERFGIFGRFGIYRSQLELHGFGATPGDESEHNTGLTWGAGLRFHVGSKIAVRAEYQRLDKVGGSSTGEDNVDFLSLGLEWAF